MTREATSAAPAPKYRDGSRSAARGFSVARLAAVFALFAGFVMVAAQMIERDAEPAGQPRASRKLALEAAPPTIAPGRRRKPETPLVVAKGPLDEDSSLDMAAQVWGRVLPEDDLARQLALLGDGPDQMKFGPVAVRRRLVETVIRAARRADYDPTMLMAIADKESSLRATARASTSSAAGLFQFIDKTWLQCVRRFGAAHGLAREAAEIEGPDDKPTIADADELARVLAMRERPYLAAVMAAEMLKRDSGKVAESIGRPLTAGETYLIHFLGTRDANLFMSRLTETPQASAAAALPRPAKANRPIFFEDGKAKAVADVHRKFEDMMGLRLDRYNQVRDIAGAMAYSGD
ncbi:MAG TPA: transglycosylase SLT domain-containing protein [Rhodoblastus sp.]|nr:transglycosylase SLT domain-containing protein [Rhodoblastus sp.]